MKPKRIFSIFLAAFFVYSFVYGLVACSADQTNNLASDIAARCAIERGNDAGHRATDDNSNPQPQTLTYKVVHRHPRDHYAFTQGLQYQDGILYESTGLYRKSGISRRVFPPAENALTANHSIRLKDNVFGEGLTLHNGMLYQLTWKSGEVYAYDPNDLSLSKTFRIEGEGWGLTSDGTNLYSSDGSALISVREDDLTPTKTIEVKLGTRKLKKLNELEWIDNCLFANIWQSTRIAVIDPGDGNVVGLIDASPLVAEQKTIYLERTRQTPDTPVLDVLNGIAYRAESDTLLLTGKHWSTIYEIKLAQASTRPH